MTSKRRFFMVCRDPQEVRQNNPKSVHYDLEEAKAYAERLVRDTGHAYFVLTPIAIAEPASPPINWTLLE